MEAISRGDGYDFNKRLSRQLFTQTHYQCRDDLLIKAREVPHWPPYALQQRRVTHCCHAATLLFPCLTRVLEKITSTKSWSSEDATRLFVLFPPRPHRRMVSSGLIEEVSDMWRHRKEGGSPSLKHGSCSWASSRLRHLPCLRLQSRNTPQRLANDGCFLLCGKS